MIQDDRGILTLPLKIIVYLILAGAIIGITTLGLQSIRPESTKNQMEKQLGEMASILGVLRQGAARDLQSEGSQEGNLRTLDIILPDEIEYLAFGIDPDPENDGNLTNTPEDAPTDNGDVIYYKLENGGKTRIPLEKTIQTRGGILRNGAWVPNSIRGKQLGVVLTSKGRYRLTFELVYDPSSKETCILTHFVGDLNPVLNPYDPLALPDSLLVSAEPATIPADGTNSEIIIQLIDRKGKRVAKEGRNISLTATLGNLGKTNLTTNSKGRATTTLNSSSIGTSVITASSPGLNNGTAYLTLTQPPIVLEFNQWINATEGDLIPDNDAATRLTRFFETSQELKYDIALIAKGTEFHLPFQQEGWPNASIEIDGKLVGEETIDSGYMITKTFPRVFLPQGNHTITIKMTNDLYIPFIGDRNLYIAKVVLS